MWVQRCRVVRSRLQAYELDVGTGRLAELVADQWREQLVGHKCSRPHGRVAGGAADPHRRHGGGTDDAQKMRGGLPAAHRHGVPYRLVDLSQRAWTEHYLAGPIEGVASQYRWGHRCTGCAAENRHRESVDLQAAEPVPGQGRQLGSWSSSRHIAAAGSRGSLSPKPGDLFGVTDDRQAMLDLALLLPIVPGALLSEDHHVNNLRQFYT
jgi:hypothetical protein